MSRVSKIYGNGAAQVGQPKAPDTVNREGYPAYKFKIREKFLQTIMTNTLGNTYYVKQNQLIAESEKVHATMLAEDPSFAAKALVYARNYGYMRTQPIYGLAMLSKVDTELFKSIFNDVIRTPNDLADFYAIRGKGGRAVKSAVSNWMNTKMSEYWAIKYGSDKKQGFSIKDMLRVAHPKAQNDLFAYLLDKEHSLEELPKIRAFEALKKATIVKDKLAAIKEGQLPHEVVTPFAGNDSAIWKALVPNMPAMALLKNLATIERHNAATENRKFIEELFSNADVIAKTKILPYRFLEAMKHVTLSWIKDSLRDAVELSFVNIPDVKGRSVVFLDVSGSMVGDRIETSSIFAVSLMKKAEDGTLLGFNDRLREIEVSKRDSMLSQAKKITATNGTNVGLPFEHILSKKEKYDNIILITDEQQNAGNPAYQVFNNYQRRINPNVQLFIIDISPYGSGAFNTDDPNIHYIFGWSDKVLDFIGLTSQGWGSMADAIESGAYKRSNSTE